MYIKIDETEISYRTALIDTAKLLFIFLCVCVMIRNHYERSIMKK